MLDLDRTIADMEGLPRKNGELVFRAPWEARAFGMAVVLIGHGGARWAEFRRILSERIAESGDDAYYGSWLASFEQLLMEDRVMTRDEVDSRAGEYGSMKREAVF